MRTNFANVLPGPGQLPPIVQSKMRRPQGGSHAHNHLAVEVEDRPRVLMRQGEHGIKQGE
jgi:hypothetical protein